MPDLASGSQVYGADFPPAQYDQDWTDFNVTATASTTGSPVVSVTTTAPTSGRLFVAIGASLRSPAAGQQTFVTYQVRADDENGPIAFTVGTDAGVSSPGIGGESLRTIGNYSLVSGLTPGRSYNFSVVHFVSGGTGVIGSRNILVFPVS